MVKSSASAPAMRDQQDKAGYQPNRQGQARDGQASRGMAGQASGHARRAQQRIQTHHERKDGQTTAMWEYRCAELGIDQWTRRIGPVNGWSMSRAMAEAIDHDEARIMGFGGKKFFLELRQFGSKSIERYQMSGFPVWKYVAERVN